MKVLCAKVTRTRNKHVVGLVEDYHSRIKKFCPIDLEYWKDVSDKTLEKFQDKGKVILLDQRGASWSSEQFAQVLSQSQDDPACKQLTFVIGPAYGWPDTLTPEKYERWSLSPATLPGELAWLLCWEQVYRGFTLIRGLPYHHGN